jgi:hypothetical protein
MEKPEVFVISRYPWQFFVTLTFRAVTVAGQRRRFWFAFLRAVADDFGLHFRDLLWCLREENGEITGRPHFHALIGGLPDHIRTPRTCLSLMHCWEYRTLPLAQLPDGKRKGELRWKSQFCGMARIRVYDPLADAAGYISKEGIAVTGSNQYESRKFGTALKVEFSESCRRYISARAQSGIRAGSAPAIEHRGIVTVVP